jgi:hypothetical protein
MKRNLAALDCLLRFRKRQLASLNLRRVMRGAKPRATAQFPLGGRREGDLLYDRFRALNLQQDPDYRCCQAVLGIPHYAFAMPFCLAEGGIPIK